MNDSTKPPSAPQILVQSIKFYKANWRALLPYVAIPVTVSLITLLLKNLVALDIFFTILSSLVGFFSTIAFLLALKDPQQSVPKVYRQSLHLAWPFAWTTLLVGLVSLGGYILLIVPGIILTILLSFATFSLIFEDQRGIKALIRSWHLVSGNKLSVFWRILFFAIASLILSIPILMVNIPSVISTFQGVQPSPSSVFGGIYSTIVYGLLVAPLGTIYSYSIYSYLKQLKPQPATTQEEAKIRTRIRIFLILGGVGIVLLITIPFIILGFVVNVFLNQPQTVPSIPLPSPESI